MNTIEKSKYMAEVTEYLETKRVHSVFEDMYRALAIEQPTDPISYLIKRLKTTRRFVTRKTYFCNRSSGVFDKRNNFEVESAL